MYGVGSTTCSWLALATIKIAGEWSWRSLTILQCIPGVLVLCCIYWIPESPRWLVAKERYEDAEAMLAHYHGNGDRTNETVIFEFMEMKKTLEMEFAAGPKKSSSYLDFVRTAGNRYRVMLLISLAMVSQYSGSNLFSNYANKIYVGAGITNQTDKILVRIGVQPESSQANDFAAEWWPDHALFGSVCHRLSLYRPLRPETALPGFDGRYRPFVHGLDHYQRAVRKDAGSGPVWIPTDRIHLAVHGGVSDRLDGCDGSICTGDYSL